MRVASPGTVIENQQSDADTRKGDLDPTLLSILQSLAKELNVGITVQSGGQAVKSDKKHQAKFTAAEIAKYKDLGRVGSGRHDAGKAADFLLFAPDIGTLNNDVVNDDNPNDEELKLLQSFVALGKKKGLKGFGSGDGYMDNYATFHADIVGTRDGGSSMWGKGSKSANTPVWLKDAFNNPDNFAPSVSDVGNDDDVGSLRREGDADPIGFIAAAETGGDPSEFIEGASISTKRPKRRRKLKRKPNDDGDNILSFVTNQFINRAPDQARAQIEGALGPDLSFLASDVLTSLQTGSGLQSLNDLVSGLMSQDTVTGRITSLGSFAAENQQLVGAVAPEAMSLLPTLPLITEILEASPRDRARLVLENKDVLSELVGMDIPSSINLLGRDVELLEAMDPKGELALFLESANAAIELNKSMLPSVEQRIASKYSTYSQSLDPQNYIKENKGFLGIGFLGGGEPEVRDVRGVDELAAGRYEALNDPLADAITPLLDFLKSDDPQKQKEAFDKLVSQFPDLIPEEAKLLTATPKEFLELPEVKSKLGDAYNLINPESDQVDIETMISKHISEQLGISTSSSRTLAFGGGEEAAKKLKSEVGSVAFEGLVDSFPILGEIIEFFINNKGILTALAVAGGASAVGGLLGGGFLGNAVAGAGTMAALRLGLGEEGYNKFQGLVGEGASKAIGIFREAFKSSGLADNEFLGPAIEGMLNFGEENPVPSLLGVTGNIGGALGAFAGTKAIDIIDNTSSTDEVLKYLQDTVPMGSQMNSILDSINMTFNASSQADPNQVGQVQGTQEQTNTGPNSKELAGVTGDGWGPVNWDNVNADYSWPPINT